jgi:hypothetical protein
VACPKGQDVYKPTANAGTFKYKYKCINLLNYYIQRLQDNQHLTNLSSEAGKLKKILLGHDAPTLLHPGTAHCNGRAAVVSSFGPVSSPMLTSV